MKKLILVLLGAAISCSAETLRLSKSTVVRTDHGALILASGTVVEVTLRTPAELQITFKGEHGTINLANGGSELANEPAPATPPKKAAAAPATGSQAAKQVTPTPVVADNPQSYYGRVVQKAQTNADQHSKNLVDPVNAITDDATKK